MRESLHEVWLHLSPLPIPSISSYSGRFLGGSLHTESSAFLHSLHFAWNTFNFPVSLSHNPIIILPEKIAAILHFNGSAALHLKLSMNLQGRPDGPWSQVLNSVLGSCWLNVSVTPQTASSSRPGTKPCPSLCSVSNRCSILDAELNNKITSSHSK